MGKPFKIKHGLLCSGHLLEVDNERDEVRIKGVRAATIDDLVGGGGSIGDINDLTTGDHSSIVGAINEVDGNTTSNANGISSLQGDLAQEILDRQSGDASLTTSLSNEVNGRINAISAVQGDVDQEILDRQTADNNLQTAINTEETARTDGDTTLNTRITNEVATLVQADSDQYNALHQEVSDEANARTIVDGSLQTQINSITSDQNKFYSLILDATDVIYDLSNGNFVAVTANQSGRAVILPAEIPNGGIKLYFQNDGATSFDVQDSNFNTLVSISAINYGIYELIFDDTSELWTVTIKDDATNYLFNNVLDTAFEYNFLSEGNTNELGTFDDYVTSVVYNQDSSIWKFSILDYSDLSEEASYTFSAPSSTKVITKFLNEQNNIFKILIAFEDEIHVVTYDRVNFTFVGSQTLSELNGVDISDMVVVNDNSILIESHTATDRNIKKYTVSGSTFTHVPTADLDITETVYGGFTKLYKFSEERFALYRETSSTVKRLTTFSIVNDIAVQLNVKNFTTKSDSIGIIDSNSFVITEGINLSHYHFDDPSQFYRSSSHFMDFFDNKIDLANRHFIYIFDFVEEYTRTYEKMGVLFEVESNKIVVFTVDNVKQALNLIDNTVHEYQLNSNICSSVISGEFLTNRLYFGMLNGTGTHYGITKLEFGQYFSEIFTSTDLTKAKYITGDIANYKNIKSDLIEADNVEANFFIGDGSLLTGIPGGYDQSLNTTDDVAFNQVTSTFYGDGSHLTGIPGGYDQDLNTTNDVTFNQVTANSFVGLPPSLKVFTINAGEGVANPTAIEDRTYTLPESGVGWQVGNAANMNAANLYGTEMGTSADDMIIAHPKNTAPFMVKVQRNKNKGFAAGMGITEFAIAYKANIANTAIRIDLFPEEEYEFWIQIVFL